MYLKEFNVRLENILQSVTKGEDVNDSVLAKAVAKLKGLLDSVNNENGVGDNQFKFIKAFDELVLFLYEKISPKLDENGELRVGEEIPAGPAAFVKEKFAEFSEFLNTNRNLEETHNAAVEEAKVRGTTPCSLCQLKAVTCHGIESYQSRGA